MQTEYIHSADSQKYKSILRSLKMIYMEEGIRGLYKGFGACMLGLSHAAIYFPVYEELKNRSASIEADQTLKVLLCSSCTKGNLKTKFIIKKKSGYLLIIFYFFN